MSRMSDLDLTIREDDAIRRCAWLFQNDRRLRTYAVRFARNRIQQLAPGLTTSGDRFLDWLEDMLADVAPLNPREALAEELAAAGEYTADWETAPLADLKERVRRLWLDR